MGSILHYTTDISAVKTDIDTGASNISAGKAIFCARSWRSLERQVKGSTIEMLENSAL